MLFSNIKKYSEGFLCWIGCIKYIKCLLQFSDWLKLEVERGRSKQKVTKETEKQVKKCIGSLCNIKPWLQPDLTNITYAGPEHNTFDLHVLLHTNMCKWTHIRKHNQDLCNYTMSMCLFSNINKVKHSWIKYPPQI